MSRIITCSCRCTALDRINGNCGINVNRNRQEGGMDMIKLYETAEALSVSPTRRTCSLKNTITSYNGTPSNPSKMIFLLFSAKKRKGGEFIMIRSMFIWECRNLHVLRSFSPVLHPVLSETLWLLPGAVQRFR